MNHFDIYLLQFKEGSTSTVSLDIQCGTCTLIAFASSFIIHSQFPLNIHYDISDYTFLRNFMPEYRTWQCLPPLFEYLDSVWLL